MKRRNQSRIIRQCWLLLFLGLGFGIVLTRSIGAEASESVCIQQCESTENACVDMCAGTCGSEGSRVGCDSCLSSCLAQFSNCMRRATWCEGETVTPGACSVNFGTLCPTNTIPYCSNAAMNENGYWLTCRAFDQYDCVSCPPGYVCDSQLPPCPY